MSLPALTLSEPSSCDDLRLGREITLLSAQMNIANFRLLKLINEFDIRGGWRSGGAMRSCAHWLAANCGMAIGAAREKVRVARRLAKLPEVEKAFSSGDLSYSKVRAISRVATDSNEGFLVMMAEQVSASHLEKLVGKYQPVDELGLPTTLGDDGGLKGSGEPLVGGGGGVGGGVAVGGGVDGNQVAGSTSEQLSSATGNEDMGLGDGATRPEGGAGADAKELNGSDGSGGPAGSGGAAVADEEQRREHARELFWFQDKDGMWVIHCKLPPEQGQLVIKMLEAVARPLQEERQEAWNEKQKAHMQAVAQHILRRHREADIGANSANGSGGNASMATDTAVGGREPIGVNTSEHGLGENQSADISTYINDALLPGAGKAVPASVESERAREKISAESLSGGGKTVPASVECERAREKISAESFSQFMNHVRADAFSAVAEHFLATSGSYEHLQNLKGAERCQVVLHVDINTLRGQGSGRCCTHSRAHFEDKPWLSPKTARRLCCDASLVTVLEDENGKVLNVGRRSRIVPPNIRRALLERDGVCQYPGCHESRYVDAHHIKHWADGGETSLDNLTTLCRFHHRELHRGSFELAHITSSST